MSELYYDPQSSQDEFSGWGFEFSMRIVPFADDPDSKSGDDTVVPYEPFWAISLMQNLAKYVYNSKKWFEAYHFIPTNSPLRLNTDTKLVGVAFAPDPVLGGIDTPNGRVEFLQMVSITQRVEQLIDMMRKDNPLLITNLKRQKEGKFDGAPNSYELGALPLAVKKYFLSFLAQGAVYKSPQMQPR